MMRGDFEKCRDGEHAVFDTLVYVCVHVCAREMMTKTLQELVKNKMISE